MAIGLRLPAREHSGDDVDGGASPSDEAVVARVVAGEIDLFEVLMRRYNQRLFRVVYAVLRDAEEARDVMQEAYVRAYQHLGSFRADASFSTWLTKIALYESYRRARLDRRRVGLEDEPMAANAAVPASGEPDGAAANLELHALLRRAIEALPAGRRLVFVCRDVEGMTTAEAARCLDISEQSVKTRLHRARAQLRGLIEDELGAACRDLYAFAGADCDAVVAGVLGRLRASAGG